MNTNALRSGREFAKQKKLWQGWLMRELHGLDIPRPVFAKPDPKGPPLGKVHVEVVFSFEHWRGRDLDNYTFFISKAFDALVGPLWQGQPKKGQKRIPANRAMIVDGARYVGGWLHDDGPEDWELSVRFERSVREDRMDVLLWWEDDVPAD
jgi:hypothetical protein